ncbi:MAG: DUF4139 domain-containing protein [Bacteroidia bacterium]
MNKRSLLFTLLLIPVVLFAQKEDEQKVNAPVTQVTVFLNGAQVTREWQGQLRAGINRLLFDNLSSAIDAKSLQATVEGNLTILSVQYRVNHLRNQVKPAGIQQLEDSLENVTYLLESVRGKKNAFEEEKSMILANKSIGGNNNGVQIAELEDGADFFRKRMTDIIEQIILLKREEKKLQDIAQHLNDELGDYNNKRNTPSHEAIVTLSSEVAQSSKVALSYYTGNAQWVAYYDIRVKNTQSPVQLFYKANISQNTGENWNNVKLKLSTGNPSVSGQKPTLNPYYLNFYQPQAYDAKEEKAQAPNFRGARAEGTAYYIDGVRVAGNAQPSVQMNQMAANIEFDIAPRYTVTADGSLQTVDIRTVDLKAHYGYQAAPKLDKDPFLVARIIGDNDLYNLSGEANIFYEGTYVGQSYINPGAEDTLTLSLGRDKRIVIERTQVKDLTAKSKIGGSIKENNTWEITIRNTRKEAAELVIEDQIPVTQNKDIEVELKDAGGAQVNTETGKLTWTVTVPPGQTLKLRFSFEVKYPKDKNINPY